ncbi:DUF5320 domain-containing protein [Hippea jasoniae]|uniref:DUF5320 domain-containing protein n=1 Tax=Hippea jasoniae TaxID=944479 RepID=UPI00054EE6B1|nr:DUF5320 domain-containing protein [Hippea jasoniae]
MPWGDRTGPFGYGPRTGRGLGYCAGNNVPGYMVGGFGFRGGFRGGFGRGWGRGFGRGFGFGRAAFWPNYYPYGGVSKEDEKRVIENEIETLTKSIEALKKRLAELNEE